MTETPLSERSIPDWSIEGRRAFVEAHRHAIMYTLDEAFTTFIDDASATLLDYGFGRGGGDPVTDAVEFCLDRFENGDLDEALVYPRDRGAILFTRVEFWLAQKVGKNAYNRIRAEREQNLSKTTAFGGALDRIAPFDRDAVCDRLDHGIDRGAFRDRFVRATLRFRQRAHEDLVGAWLEGSHGMRHAIFSLNEKDPPPETRWSGKKRSMHVADALFRFLDVFFEALEPVKSLSRELVVYELCTRPPFDDPGNFRRLDSTVGKILKDGSRTISRKRKEAVGGLLTRRLGQLEEEDGGFFEKLLIRSSLRGSIIHVHRLDTTNPETRAMIEQLKTLKSRTG